MVLAFSFVGVSGVTATSREEVLSAFESVTGMSGGQVDERPNVLILTETAASLIPDEEIEWQKTGHVPLIVEVPGLNGHLEGRKTLSESIAEAIGIKV